MFKRDTTNCSPSYPHNKFFFSSAAASTLKDHEIGLLSYEFVGILKKNSYNYKMMSSLMLILYELFNVIIYVTMMQFCDLKC